MKRLFLLATVLFFGTVQTVFGYTFTITVDSNTLSTIVNFLEAHWAIITTILIIIVDHIVSKNATIKANNSLELILNSIKGLLDKLKMILPIAKIFMLKKKADTKTTDTTVK